MDVVILAGGFGTRISEESQYVPKPLIEIGGKPIIVHIMSIFYKYGFNNFIICAGYKAYKLKEYFSNFWLHNSNIEINISPKNINKIKILNSTTESWNVKVIDTGLYTGTAGRIKLVKDYIKGNDFFLTYGDGVSDINVKELLNQYKRDKKIATLTAIQPGSRYGSLKVNNKNNLVESFKEKTKEDGGWVNGGFMVLNKKVVNYINDESEMFEQKPLQKLSEQNMLTAYKHYGFWQCMDTLREKNMLDELIRSNKAPWLK